jgi:hypothetical protein
MTNMISQYEGLSTREGFNSSLKHFQLVMDIIGSFDSYTNLADIINEFILEKSIIQEQIKPLLHALLIDKFAYTCSSYNLEESVNGFETICEEISKWTALDLVIAYYSPELGIITINPKNKDHWDAVQTLKKNELVTIYCGAFAETEKAKKQFEEGIEKFISLINGKKVKTPDNFTGGKFKQKIKQKKSAKEETRAITSKKIRAKKKEKDPEAVPTPALVQAPVTPVPAKKMGMTPLYGITVTNELFHNGNVEAWKKIIQSYEYYHQGLHVYVYYDGEQIHDINTLFKWGKVKRGTAIMISVGGENICDVAKLQRYLRQGASSMFEAFLKGHPHQVLKLF